MRGLAEKLAEMASRIEMGFLVPAAEAAALLRLAWEQIVELESAASPPGPRAGGGGPRRVVAVPLEAEDLDRLETVREVQMSLVRRAVAEPKVLLWGLRELDTQITLMREYSKHGPQSDPPS